MKPWCAGDPVGMGEVFLPDKKTRDAYASACRDDRTDSAAKYTINLPTLQARRDFINNYPIEARDALRDRIKQLWEASR